MKPICLCLGVAIGASITNALWLVDCASRAGNLIIFLAPLPSEPVLYGMIGLEKIK